MSRSVITLGLLAIAGLLAPRALPSPVAPFEDWQFTRDFCLDDCRFAALGGNDFFPLDPGRFVVLEGVEDGELHRVEMTVLDRVERVGDVVCRVVEEVEQVDGELVQVARSFHAVDVKTRNVYCFGEQVDEYEDGRLVGHDGSWRAWQDGAKPGLTMPGTILSGARWYTEDAPGVAQDRAEIVEYPEAFRTPAGNFRGGVKIEETSPLEPDETATKGYAPNVGLVKDESLKLVAWGG